MGVKKAIKDFAHIVKNYSDVSKFYTQTTSRPAIMQPYMATDTGAKLPIFPWPLIMVYELADNIDGLRIPIETIQREMFKNGLEVVEKFQYKCENCGKEFKYKPLKDEEDIDDKKKPDKTGGNIEKPEPKEKADDEKKEPKGEDGKSKVDELKDVECDSCGSTHLVRPIPEHRKTLEALYKRHVNTNHQTFEDVARQLERDLEVADNAYLLILKDYWIDETKKEIIPEKTKIKELLRVDPPQFAIICDSDGRLGYDDKRNPIWVCPRFEHRNKRLTTNRCDVPGCGIKGLKAICEVSSVYSIGLPQPKRVIYGEGEIIWKAGKYKPGLIYGYSPIYAIWSKAMALSHMDEYIRKYFDKMRPPRGLLVIASKNYETFKKAWDALEEKATEDPYMIHPLMVESDKGGRNMAQWLDFTGSLKELEFMELRKEMRMVILATYGLQQIFAGESAGKGQSNEGLELTVTNRTMEWGQRELKRSFFDPLAEMMDVDDWDLKLKDTEETDKLRDLEIEAQEIENHGQLQNMGFAVERTHQGGWKSSKKPTFEQMPMDKMGRGPGKFGDKDKTGENQGQPPVKRNSDPGGTSQGNPAAGDKKDGGINHSKKSIDLPMRGHSHDYWMKWLIKIGGYDQEEADIIINGWNFYDGLYYPMEKIDSKEKKITKYHIKQTEDGELDIIGEENE